VSSVVLLDYGSGNLRSAERALQRAGAEVTLTKDYDTALEADGLVVPGVGAFAACMRGIHAVRGGTLVWDRLRKQRPVLGICVGMQVMFEEGDEHGVRTEGLGVLPGSVTRLQADVVPHMGWNTVDVPAGSTLFDGLQDERFYFVHSYAVHGTVEDTLTTTSEHGERFVAAVERGVLAATQFHPEKSGDAGAALLRNWVQALA
jgi:imidazole glycerol-phosphate synthase subunit HisH